MRRWALIVALLLASIAALAPTAMADGDGGSRWRVASGPLNVRSAPTRAAPVVGRLQTGQEVNVLAWVRGEKVSTSNLTWAQIGPNQYVFTAYLIRAWRAAPPPLPDGIAHAGRWIDVNLTRQVMTAYEGQRALYWAVISSGRPGDETPSGSFRIVRRVANETMDSSTLEGLEERSVLRNVLYTQYFDWEGRAIHYNYWKYDSPFGVPTSRGGLSVNREDAAYFWNFATLGTPVEIHR